jgi:hypothetical protein
MAEMKPLLSETAPFAWSRRTTVRDLWFGHERRDPPGARGVLIPPGAWPRSARHPFPRSVW